MKKQFYLIVIVAIFCGKVNFITANEIPPAAESPTVIVGKSVSVKESSPKRFIGFVESIEHIDILPRVSGNILKTHFKEGSLVNKGDLLYEIEDTSYKAHVAQLEAQKEVLMASLKYAETEFQRNSQLLEKKAISVATHDKTVLEISSAKANINAITASLIDAYNTLSYTRIYAPISGQIGKNIYSDGNLISPQTGKLTDIEKITPIYVRFSVSEPVFRRDFGGVEGVKNSIVIRLLLADQKQYSESAKVTLIDNKISKTSNQITLWATFENKDHQLIPGGFVTVLASIKKESPLVAVIPSALMTEKEGSYVYVLDSANHAQKRKVKTEQMAGNLQIISEGLAVGERVIIDGNHKVRDGMIVTPVIAAEGK